MRILTAAGLTAALLGTGCLPIPHIKTTRPEVHGYLTLHNEPVPDAKIQYSGEWQDDACSSPEESGTTSEYGAFAFPAKRHFWFLVPLLPIHCIQGWSLCINAPESDQVLWRGGGYGPCVAPWELHLDCELSRSDPQPIPDISTPYSNEPTCRYRNLPSHEVPVREE